MVGLGNGTAEENGVGGGGSSLEKGFMHNCNTAKPPFCGRYTLVGRTHEHAQTLRLVPLRCKRWICPVCGPRKAMRLRRAIIRVAAERDLSRFLTLTLDPKNCDPHDSYDYIKDCWHKFRVYLKRKYGVSIPFIWIIEPQKSGYAHLHILVDRFIQQRWISKAWRAVGGGKIVFIKKVDAHRIATYLAKYLTKELLQAHLRPNQRRFATSRDISLFTKVKGGSWRMVWANLDYFYRYACKGRITREQRDANGTLVWIEIPDPIPRSALSQTLPTTL